MGALAGLQRGLAIEESDCLSEDGLQVALRVAFVVGGRRRYIFYSNATAFAEDILRRRFNLEVNAYRSEEHTPILRRWTGKLLPASISSDPANLY